MSILGRTLEMIDAEGRRKGWTTMSDETISNECDLPIRTVQSGLRALERTSWVQRATGQSDRAIRELRVGPMMVETVLGERALREMRSGQGMISYERPRMPGPRAAVPLGGPVDEMPVRKAVGAESAISARNFLRAENCGYTRRKWRALPLYTELSEPPPPPASSVLQNATDSQRPPNDEEEDALCANLNGEETEDFERVPENLPPAPADHGRNAHIAGGLGPLAGDHEAVGEKTPAAERSLNGVAANANGQAPEWWICWCRGWDGLPPLPMDAERPADLEVLKLDLWRLGAEVLEEAVRQGRAQLESGRFRLFDLRRYCGGLRSTCVSMALRVVKKRKSARLTAAQETGVREWDEHVKELARELRAEGRQVSLAEAEKLLRERDGQHGRSGSG